MTGQTWTDMMYKVMNSEHAWSSFYFVLVILIMNFWILNLFVAVIIDAEAMSEERENDRNKGSKKASESSEEYVPQCGSIYYASSQPCNNGRVLT